MAKALAVVWMNDGIRLRDWLAHEDLSEEEDGRVDCDYAYSRPYRPDEPLLRREAQIEYKQGEFCAASANHVDRGRHEDGL